MGYRTVVVLYNDHSSTWSVDPDLGRKIATGMNFAIGRMAENPYTPAHLGYGRVVECTHADTQTLAVVDSYDFKPIVHSHRRPNESGNEMQIRLLKEAADELGYRLVKKADHGR